MLYPEKMLVLLDTAWVVALVLEEYVSVTGHGTFIVNLREFRGGKMHRSI